MDTHEGIINWNAIYYGSVILFALGVASSFFNAAISAIAFAFIIALWTEIPGLINPYLAEVNMGDFFLVLLALQYGGLPIAVLTVPYFIFAMYAGKMYRTSDTARIIVGVFIAVLLTPIVHAYITHGNILLTIYAYTIVEYAVASILAVIISPVKLLEGIGYLAIALPIAFITNTIYLKLFGDLTQRFLQGNVSFGLPEIVFFGIVIAVATIFKFLIIKQQKQV